MALLAGYLLGWGTHNDLAYDGTAFWLHVSTGVPGRADRLGRLAPTAVLGAVLVPGYAVLSSAVTGRWSMLPADLGAGVALLLSGFGVASVLSALKPYPVPAAGDSPFSPPPGAMGVTLVVQLVAGIAVTLLSAPVAGPVAGRPRRRGVGRVGGPGRWRSCSDRPTCWSACARAPGSTTAGRPTC